MSNPEVLYSARQVTEALGCSSQMAGKYFQALEKVTRTKIKTQGRDGRQFSREQRDVLLAARNIVRSDSAMTVENAIRRAVGLSAMPVDMVTTDTPGISLDALSAALSRSQQPLLDEVRALRQDLARLSSTAESETTKKEPGSGEKQDDRERHGLMVRFALWLEGRLQRLR